MFPRTLKVNDFWRVNSYGYPNAFNNNEKSQEAWNTLLSFFDFKDYEALKKFWASSAASRKLSSHAVESWKANFEELGLLYVPSRSNEIIITPAGIQLREAADRNDKDEFAWIGLNLLMRYPLRGPRRPKSTEHEISDLLLYKFLFAALLDLGGYIWWTEFERILCRVFQTKNSENSVLDIIDLRKDPSLIELIDLPVENRMGMFYNSLNQVMVHAGMNHLLLGTTDEESPYGITEPKRKQFINNEWIMMVRRALFCEKGVNMCSNKGMTVLQIPNAPNYDDETSYFEYLGNRVILLEDFKKVITLNSIDMHGDKVYLLNNAIDYRSSSNSEIIGSVSVLCQIARGQRLILSHDERWTYLVVDKELIDSDNVKVHLHRAKPILDIEKIKSLFGGNNV